MRIRVEQLAGISATALQPRHGGEKLHADKSSRVRPGARCLWAVAITLCVAPLFAVVSPVWAGTTFDNANGQPALTGAPDPADLKLFKTVSPATVYAGELLTYKMEIVNDGPGAASDVVLSDMLDNLINNTIHPTTGGVASVSLAPGDSTGGLCSSSPGTNLRQLSCGMVMLPVCIQGSTCPVVTVVVRPGGDGGTRTNYADVASNTTIDPNFSNNGANASNTVLQRADVTVTQTATPNPASVGQDLVYVITAKNNGPSRADTVNITDSLPLDVTYVSAATTGGGSCTTTPMAGSTIGLPNRQLICGWSSLANKVARTVTVTVRPNTLTLGTTLRNDVSISAATVESDVTNNDATVSVPVGVPQLDLQAGISDSPDPVGLGEQMLYTLTVTNSGPSYAENVVLSNLLPSDKLSFVSATPAIGTCSTVPAVGSFGGTMECSVGGLATGSSATVSVRMKAEDVGTTTAGSRLVVSSEETRANPAFDTNPANNTAEEKTTVVSPVLTVVVTGSGTVSAGALPVPLTGGVVGCDSSGSSNCVANYRKDDVVSLVATPATGHSVAFAGACSVEGSVTMADDRSCSATFAPSRHAISGSLVNLAGSGLMLHLDYGSGTEAVSAAAGDVGFAFVAEVPYGAAYMVTVSAQPADPSQTCSVVNGSGTMPDVDVSDISVTCITNRYTVGGTVTGLTGSGLILQLNNSDDLAVTGSTFTFAAALESGSSYAVSIHSQPFNQVCALGNASGTLTAGDISDVAVNCVAAQPQLTLSIDDGRIYARYGRMVDYLVTLTNSGDGVANEVEVSSVLSAGLDSDYAQWRCIGAGSGATCATTGIGALADTVTLPAGRSLNWIVSVPVRFDANEDNVQVEISVTGATSVTDTNTLVILRDGFDVPYGSGSRVIAPALGASILDADTSLAFGLPPTDDERIAEVMQLRVAEADISIERMLVVGSQFVRIVQHSQSEQGRVSAWVPVAGEATLSIASVATDDGQRILLLEGAAQVIYWPRTQ